MGAIEIPAAPRISDAGVRMFGFTVGHVHMSLSFFLDGEAGQIKAPVTAFLIDHPRGLALFDTGLGSRFERPKGSPLEGFIDLEAGDTMAARLRGIGVDASDVRWIIASHLHADHAGGNVDFPNATVVVQESEVDFARAEADGMLYALEEFDTGQPFLKLHGEHDLFGDGTVIVFPTPGHTPGHQSARVRTDHAEIVLTGDCCSMRRSLEDFRLPDHCHNADQFIGSLHLLRKMQDRGARVFPSHDPDFWAEIPKAVPIV